MTTHTLPRPLTNEEERLYVEQVSLGDEFAFDKLVEHNLRLVVFVVNRFQNTKYDREDLFSIGTIGLIKAVRTFDPTKNIKFNTYAAKCIENEILMKLRKNKKQNQDVFLEEVVSNDKDGNQLTIFDLLGTDKEIVEENIEKKETIEFLRNVIEELPENEKMIIKYRFGIDCIQKKQSDIAKIFNISQSYVSRIEQRVLLKIKKKLKKF